SADVVLTNNVARPNLSGALNSEKHFYIPVRPGATRLTVTMSGGSGNADIHVQRGQRATTRAYRCRPYKTNNNETCVIDRPATGNWFVMLRARTAYARASLKANYTPDCGTSAISPTLRTITAYGVTGTIAVTAPTGCSWKAVSNVAWIKIVSGISLSGKGKT